MRPLLNFCIQLLLSPLSPLSLHLLQVFGPKVMDAEIHRVSFSACVFLLLKASQPQF